MEKYKEKLLGQLELHIKFIREKVKESVEVAKVLANKDLKEIYKMSPEERMVNMNLKTNAQNRVTELTNLDSSPYFIKCKVINKQGEEKEYFFSKHQFIEHSIYSWVAPVATIRFDNPGKTSYRVPNGKMEMVTIKQKEQYMIVDGKVIFFAVEAESEPRKLIYQEYFTEQKAEFALPEIVAQMEKAQDQVIRTSYKGPIAISGPAGSGKTTLALHRVAYLNQFPDTAKFFPPSSIAIFVQDIGTKDYFSTLLPGLGINDIHITTFSEWAFKILDINDHSYVERYRENGKEKDLYEYQKLRALRGNAIQLWNKNIFSVLRLQYEKYFSSDNLRLFNKQKKEKKLDRFDLAILLKSYFNKYGKFEIKREYQTFIKDKLVNKIEKTPISYSLMIIDEFQNYLPEQLHIFKSCQKKDTQSIVYVGDMAQQTKFGTIRSWEDIKELIPPERDIVLKKVYRNTKNILLFIQGLGYKIEIPSGVKEGPMVVERIVNTVEEEISHIKRFIPKYEHGTIGILAKDESYLENFKKEFALIENIHILTIIECQGVEFDLVFFVGIGKTPPGIEHSADISIEYVEERKRLQKNLLYLALTRAITELHVLGREKLKTPGSW